VLQSPNLSDNVQVFVTLPNTGAKAGSRLRWLRKLRGRQGIVPDHTQCPLSYLDAHRGLNWALTVNRHEIIGTYLKVSAPHSIQGNVRQTRDRGLDLDAIAVLSGVVESSGWSIENNGMTVSITGHRLYSQLVVRTVSATLPFSFLDIVIQLFGAVQCTR